MNKIISELPQYVFENKFDEFYFFDFDSVFFDNHESFTKSMKAFLQLNSNDVVIIEEFGQKDYSQIIMNTSDIRERLIIYAHNKDTIELSRMEYLHIIAENIIIYSNNSEWCFYFDRLLELGVCGIKLEVSDKFNRSFTNRDLYWKSINDYFNWLREINRHRPNETENFISEFIKNYNLRS